MNFSKRVKLLREEKKLTQEELAKAVDISRSNISKYENNQLEASIEQLIKLSEFFSVTVDYLLGLSDERNETIPEGWVKVVADAYARKISADEVSELIEFLDRKTKKL